MWTPKQILEQYSWLYGDLLLPPGTWDFVFDGPGAYVAVKQEDDCLGVYCRGSDTGIDWIDDAIAWPTYDPVLGPVHTGFRLGVERMKPKLDEYIGDRPRALRGHSLGAGHAALLAGYWAAENRHVTDVTMFGEPPSCTSKLGDIVAARRNSSPVLCQ